MLKEVIVATNNEGKIKEMKHLLNGLNIEVKALKDVFDEAIDIVEDGETFEENAIIKSETICKRLNTVVIADDSGLEIDALDKEPGVQSARYLGYDTPYDVKNAYILEVMEGQSERTAIYVCSIAVSIPNQKTVVFTETMEGEIALKPEGENGFGYDPIFYFPPVKTTTASMSLDEKNKYSHRAKALMHVVELLKEMK